MMEILKPQWDAWIADNKEKGLPADELVNELYSIFQELGVNDPFIR
jgi:hypothetical protein